MGAYFGGYSSELKKDIDNLIKELSEEIDTELIELFQEPKFTKECRQHLLVTKNREAVYENINNKIMEFIQ